MKFRTWSSLANINTRWWKNQTCLNPSPTFEFENPECPTRVMRRAALTFQWLAPHRPDELDDDIQIINWISDPREAHISTEEELVHLTPQNNLHVSHWTMIGRPVQLNWLNYNPLRMRYNYNRMPRTRASTHTRTHSHTLTHTHTPATRLAGNSLAPRFYVL